jgi:TolB-like protein
MKKKILKYFVAMTLLTLPAGCATKIYHFSSFFDESSVQHVKKVGVIPFYNESGRRTAGEIMTNIFILGVFQSGLFQVEEKGNIEQFLYREKIRDTRSMKREKLKRLGKRLNLDAVFMGTVEEFKGGNVGSQLATPKVSLRVNLVETRSGKILWSARHSRSGDDYIKIFDVGIVRTVDTLAKKIVLEALGTIKG